MSTTTNLDTLTINYLTQAQYDAEVQAGTIDEDAIYMTPSTSTATPTANTVSKFDSSAHMNSSDMSAQDVTSFVNALDTQGTNLVDYVVGTGVDGIWTYRKWASGLYDAWYEGGINLLAGTAWGGMYYHQSSSALDPPSFSQSVTSLVGGVTKAQLAMFCGVAANYSQYWVTGNSAASTIQVRLDMHGTW